MTKVCSLVTCEKAGALYTNGKLIIWATGMKPTPCHAVDIIRSPLTVEPPQFSLVGCVDEGQICTQILTPFKVARQFSTGAHQKVILYCANGKMELEVRKVDDIKALGGEMPVPFVLSPSDSGHSITLSRHFKTSGVAELPLGSKEVSKAIDDAYDNAQRSVPPPNGPDGMTIIKILGVTVTYGGITGQNRVSVEIDATVVP